MKTIITDFFHVGVLPNVFLWVGFEPVSLEAAREICQAVKQDALFDIEPDTVESAVRHEVNADLFSAQLGVDVPCNRITVHLQHGTQFLIGDYRGPELEPGTTELPKGAEIKWRLATVG